MKDSYLYKYNFYFFLWCVCSALYFIDCIVYMYCLCMMYNCKCFEYVEDHYIYINKYICVWDTNNTRWPILRHATTRTHDKSNSPFIYMIEAYIYAIRIVCQWHVRRVFLIVVCDVRTIYSKTDTLRESLILVYDI